MKNAICLAVVMSAATVLGISASAQSQQADMTFFVTSAGPGKGADLGGLAGADAHCQSLAQAVGAGNKPVAGLFGHECAWWREPGSRA